MVSGENARFLRGCRMGFCPHSKTAEVWTAISISAPLWLKLWGSTVRRDGSLFVTRQAAKFCMSGEFRTPEFWMNSVIALICWKHTFKEIKPAWYRPSCWGELAAASDAMLSSALKTFSICPGQGIIRTKSSFHQWFKSHLSLSMKHVYHKPRESSILPAVWDEDLSH